MKYAHHCIASLLGALFATGTVAVLPKPVIAPLLSGLGLESLAPASLAMGPLSAGHVMLALVCALLTGLAIFVLAVIFTRTQDDIQTDEDNVSDASFGDMMAYAEPAESAAAPAPVRETGSPSETPDAMTAPIVQDAAPLLLEAPATATAVAQLSAQVEALAALVRDTAQSSPAASPTPAAGLTDMQRDLAVLADKLQNQPPATIDPAQMQALFQSLADALRNATLKIDTLTHRVDALMSRQAMMTDQLSRAQAQAQTPAPVPASPLPPVTAEPAPLRLPTSPRLTDSKTARRLASALNELRKATGAGEGKPG